MVRKSSPNPALTDAICFSVYLATASTLNPENASLFLTPGSAKSAIHIYRDERTETKHMGKYYSNILLCSESEPVDVSPTEDGRPVCPDLHAGQRQHLEQQPVGNENVRILSGTKSIAVM